MPEGLLVGLELLVGMVMEGVLVGVGSVGETDGDPVGEAVGVAVGEAVGVPPVTEALPPVTAKLVMSVQSMGRKLSVGTPLARIWFIPP